MTFERGGYQPEEKSRLPSGREVPSYTPMSKRERPQEQRTENPSSTETTPQLSPLEKFRQGLKAREAVRLAPLVDSAESDILGKISGFAHDKQLVKNVIDGEEKSLLRDEALLKESNQPGGIGINRGAYNEALKPFRTEDDPDRAWEDTIKARKMAIKRVKERWGIQNQEN